MVEIISKRTGPRNDDAPVKRLIEQNRSTIVRLADQISNGGYSASKAPRPKPKAQGLIIHIGSGSRVAEEAKPEIRVSLNGRVIAVDQNSGRQIHHIGEIRRWNGMEVFVLATKENGFFSPVDDAVAAALASLDGAGIGSSLTEEQLATQIGTLLGIGN